MSLKYSNKLHGKRVVVVGGTSGIGFSTAEAAVEYGAIVTVASSTQHKVDRAIARIQAQYPEAKDRIRGKTIDLNAKTVEEEIVALYDFASDGGKQKLDHVVTTAGGTFSTVPLADATAEAMVDLYQVRMVGTLMLAKIAMRYLHVSAESSFTLTGGVSDAKPTKGWTMLAPVGGAARALTHALANDMRPVRANCICPGAVMTELFRGFGRDKLQEIVDLYTAKTLTGSIGEPEDLALCYISVMKNKFMTGQEVTVDGGYLLA
jgi:NAD(P)-dependent dehydrogenase (short-subunit alcohol dehydrogenase family)